LQTVKLVWLINCVYDEVYINKPYTSRPANSEKYIIAKNFKGISDEYINKLYTIIDNWDNIDSGMIIYDLFGPLPEEYINIFKIYNKYNCNKQLKNIIKTLQLIKNQNKQIMDNIISNQIIYAIKWCVKYNMEINSYSEYVTFPFSNNKYINL